MYNIFIFCGPAAFGKGGMERTAINLANYWAEDHIVTFGYFSRDKQRHPAYEVDSKVILAPWDKNKMSYEGYKNRILGSKPDVFFIFGASSQIILISSFVYGTNIPMVIHEGSNPKRIIEQNWAEMRKISRMEAMWERETVLGLANVVRFTMEEYKKSLSSAFVDRVVAFPNAFSNDLHKYADMESKRIINIGGLKPNKNIYPLLKAFKRLVKEHPEWKLYIYSAIYQGTGIAYAEDVEEFIRRNGLENNIFLMGEIDDIQNEYLKASIHVITSLSEGLSSSVAEAMTFGIPSVGIKNVDGVDGLIIDGENGLLVENLDLEYELFTVLTKLINSNELRHKLSRGATKSARQFNPEKIFEHWDNVLDHAINKKAEESEVISHYRRSAYSLYRSVVGEPFHSIHNIMNEDMDDKCKEVEELLHLQLWKMQRLEEIEESISNYE